MIIQFVADGSSIKIVVMIFLFIIWEMNSADLDLDFSNGITDENELVFIIIFFSCEIDARIWQHSPLDYLCKFLWA